MADAWAPPEWLPDSAHVWWTRIVEELRQNGQLARASRLTVATLAVHFAQFSDAVAEVESSGLTQPRSSADGAHLYDVPSAVFFAQVELTKQMCKLIRELKLNHEAEGEEAVDALVKRLVSAGRERPDVRGARPAGRAGRTRRGAD